MTLRLARVSERVEQQHIVQLLRTLGASVYVIGTVRKKGDYPGTCQTPGLPDLVAFLPNRADVGMRQLWIEVKAVGGRLAPAQSTFRSLCAMGGQAHVVGGLDAVIAWLVAEGYLHDAQIPHYRWPAADPLESQP